MAEQMSTLENEALKLPTSERAKLAEILLASLDKPDPDVDKYWADEADERVRAYEEGELEVVPAAEVFGKYKAK